MRLLYKTGPMESLRKWFYKPKRDDRSLLAQFFFADDALNMVAAELDSFDGRKDPERCSTLVNQLRHAQDRVLNITSQIMDQILGDERVARGFRVKFPEDVLHDNLAGQLWFGAECLAAGSSIMNREEESAAMRPLAKALTRSLETVRSLLREQCLRPRGHGLSLRDDMLHESLRIFDRLFAEFELCYVSAMVNVKTPHEFEAQQLICVLFSESLRRALKQNLLKQEQVDSYDPALMFAVPRLAIVSGLLIYSSGPLSKDLPPEEMSDMFRPFRTLLNKIRTLLWTLDRRELMVLERLLCTNEDITNLSALDLPKDQSMDDSTCPYPDIGEFVNKFYAENTHCRDLYTQSSSEPTMTESDYLPDNIEVMTPIIDGLKRLDEPDSEVESSVEVRLSRHYSTDTTSTEERDSDPRKISRTDSNDLASLRNLSTNGLVMFDPLVVSTERQLPDNDLVTSLNEQVTEIADRLSSIMSSEAEIEHSQKHSFSTNDMPSLITNSEEYNFSGPRNEQLSCMPSTSHGYLIPNAINHEPVLSLSQNGSAIFNPEDEADDITTAMMNSELPIIIPDSRDNEILNANISMANANLTSLLLSNDELESGLLDETMDNDDTSFHSAKMTLEKDDERVKFMLGYESEHESPADSGVSTENTSLDRSPDTDQSKDIKENHFMQQNRVLDNTEVNAKNKLDSSFSDANDGSVNINYAESDAQKNEAGSSRIHALNRISDEGELSEATNSHLHNWGANAPTEEFRSLDEVITELRRQRESDTRIRMLVNDNNSSSDNPVSSQSTSRPTRTRKSSKSRRKKKMWSPGMVILDNRSTLNQNSPLRLDLDHFVDESSSRNEIPECADDEQIAIALQAHELRARNQARGKFKSSEDLIHRLFVCIAGVADQLQTNFAADLSNILKSVFLMNQTPDAPETPEDQSETNEKHQTIEYEATEDEVIQNGSSFDSVYSAEEVYADSTSDSTGSESNPRLVRRNTVNSATMAAENSNTEETRRVPTENTGNLQASVSTGDLTYREDASRLERAPEWVPDIAAPACMRCAAHFSAFRRRHHCRNCGKVFCASCSSNSIPLPRFGQLKPVRVCEECFRSLAANCRR
ncbi:hypothetical protein ACJJTC_014194 [Scirpophaga incertulas]